MQCFDRSVLQVQNQGLELKTAIHSNPDRISSAGNELLLFNQPVGNWRLYTGHGILFEPEVQVRLE